MFNRKVEKTETITLSENVKKQYQLNYTLTYEEAYESFYQLSNKWSNKRKLIIGIFLTTIAVIMLVLRFFDKSGIHYSFIAFVAILMLFYLIYAPLLKAKFGAWSVARQKGRYKFTVTAKGELILPNGEVMELANDKDARVIETSRIFVLRPDGRHTFCIPKRILKSDEAGIREIFKAYLTYQFN
jgi:hypothetical protein